QVGAFGDEVGVEAADFRDAAADVLDVGDLRTEVAVQQLQAVQHAFRLQVVDQLDQLRGGQTEHAAIAGGGVPVAAHADRGLDAHADDGLDAHDAAALQDDRDLGGGFHHEHAIEAELDGGQAQVDEFLILVAIADDQAAGLLEVGERDHHFRLAADFEAVFVARTKGGDLLDHLRLLVHLDRVDALVVALVAEVVDGGTKGCVQAVDLRVEDVFDTQQHGHLEITFQHAFDDVHELDLRIERARGYVAPGTDTKIVVAPALEAVQILRHADVPGFSAGCRLSRCVQIRCIQWHALKVA